MSQTLQPQSRALSRRSFLVTAGGLGIAVAFGGLPDLAYGAAISPPPRATSVPTPGLRSQRTARSASLRRPSKWARASRRRCRCSSPRNWMPIGTGFA
ncbi:twin-arginine translocation signal domain-containing protein [Roseibium aggregatum]|uniref:twin-arginine translocation signal domain-containing protein n=1 Tax=Roseibium aggregatum TaxID=187304 RepID=UPI003A7F4214